MCLVIGTLPDPGYLAYVDRLSKDNLDVGLYGVLVEIDGDIGYVPFLIQKSETLHPHRGIF